MNTTIHTIDMKKRFLIYAFIYITILVLLYNPIAAIQGEKILEEQGRIELYFCKTTNCEYFLTSFLKQTNSVCAFYDLGLKNLTQTLLETNTSVKLFEENYEEELPENIKPVGSKALMHHKFCTDGKHLITGSWNPTQRGTYNNDNYILFIDSPSIAENHKLAYESLEKEQEAKPLHVNLSGILIKNYFCPAHNCEEKVIEELQRAKNSVHMLAFSFTSEPIAQELIRLQQNNVSIEILFEKTRIASYSQYEYLAKHNVSVYKDTNSYTMHEKAIIIDGKTSILGSYNPTKAATEKNDENILILHEENIAQMFIREFEELTG